MRPVDGRVVVVLAIGLVAVRLAAAFALRHTFLSSGFPGYDEAASNLVHGRGFVQGGEPFSQFPPLYPLLVAAAYEIGGRAWWSIATMQTFFDIGSLIVLFALGRRLFGRTAAIVACAAFVLYAPLASQSAQLLPTSPFVLTLLSFLYLLVRLADRPRVPTALLAGLVAGIGFELRAEIPVVVLLAPVSLVLLGLSMRAALRFGALTVVAFVIALVPATIRNALTFRVFNPGPAEAGITLWEGNSPFAARFVAAGRSGDLLFELPGSPHPPVTAGPYERDHFWRDRSLHWIDKHPGAFLHGLRVKFVALWRSEERRVGKECRL